MSQGAYPVVAEKGLPKGMTVIQVKNLVSKWKSAELSRASDSRAAAKRSFDASLPQVPRSSFKKSLESDKQITPLLTDLQRLGDPKLSTTQRAQMASDFYAKYGASISSAAAKAGLDARKAEQQQSGTWGPGTFMANLTFVSHPVSTTPPATTPADYVVELRAPYSVGDLIQSSNVPAGYFTSEASSDPLSGKVSSAVQVWGAFMADAYASGIAGQFVDIPAGYDHVDITFNWTGLKYEMTASAALGFYSWTRCGIDAYWRPSDSPELTPGYSLGEVNNFENIAWAGLPASFSRSFGERSATFSSWVSVQGGRHYVAAVAWSYANKEASIGNCRSSVEGTLTSIRVRAYRR